MRSPRRLLGLAVLAALVAAWALPAAATEEPEATTTTVAEALDVPPPAVTVPPPPSGEEAVDWTYRYLIPTLVALAVVVVIATVVQYFLQVVRKRYKVVE